MESRIEFIWDGSHLLQEKHHKTDRTYQYIYSHPASYEPLAQVENDGEKQSIYYFHCDQIGIPRELTDEQGKLCWYGDYQGWGVIKHQTSLIENIHQPFRLQNQYYDQETGLHYNFYRYYDSHMGRFTQRDPIGLLGGENLYQFAPNTVSWVDPLGLNPIVYFIIVGAISGAAVETGTQMYDNVLEDDKKWNDFDYSEIAISAGIGAITGPAVGNVAKCAKLGKELKIGKNMRIAPFGNRTNHPIGKYPHYHRRGKPVNGKTPDAQGIGRHRPWETKQSDSS
ncbi:RHS repeat domain-containing protein [Volucribacter amazonae]|uniref:RHS protein conserved region domain-containing protein n=1 Tax=Volucribacter amazonae TaxID=256731 RepID=A0A9X4PBF0_9PAST|nr:RHS repeat-associated core domain-containing protein [Volucribacter amazonae]MDG6894246.1 hypothetical protein [Volucribacter amazonae]